MAYPSTEHRITLYAPDGTAIGLDVARMNNQGPGIGGRFGPISAGDKPSAEEIPLMWNDFAGGMGAGHVYTEGMYAWAINGYCRSPKIFMPGGMLIEVDLPPECTSDDNKEGVITGGFVWEQKEKGWPWYDTHIDDDLVIFCGRYMLKFDQMGAVESSVGLGKISTPTIIFDAGPRKQLVDGLMYSGIPIVTQMNLDKPDSWLPADRAILIYGTDGRWYDTYYVAGRSQSFPFDDPVNAVPMVGEHLVKIYEEADQNVGGMRLYTNDSRFTYAMISSASRNDIGDKRSWNDLNPVGEPTSSITNLVGSNRHFYVLKTDGVYDIQNDGAYQPNLTPPWKTTPHYMNGRAAIWHDGFLWTGMVRGIDRIDAVSRTRLDEPGLVNPGAPGMPSNVTPVNGIYTACTEDAGWVVFSVFNGKDSHIIYGKDRNKMKLPYDGPGPVVWHGSECTLKDQKVTMLMTTAKGVNGECGMWIGTLDRITGKPRLFWLSIPRSGNPLQDYLTSPGRHLFAPEAQLYLPIDDWKAPGAIKILRRITINTENLTATLLKRLDEDGNLIDVDPAFAEDYLESELIETDEVRAEMDVLANMDVGSRGLFDDANRSRELYWRVQGTATQSPRASFVPAVRDAKGHQVALMVRGRLAQAENPNYHPFVLRGIEVSAQVIYNLLPTRQYAVIMAKDKSSLSGAHDPRSMQVLFEQLSGLMTAGPIHMVDEDGNKLQVVLEPDMTWDKIPERHTQPWTQIIKLRVTILARPFYWDTEATWDSVFIWS